MILTHVYLLRVNHIKHYLSNYTQKLWLEKSYPKFTKPKSEVWVTSSNLLVAKYLKNNMIIFTFMRFYPKIQKYEFSNLPQNDRSKRRSTCVDYVLEVGFEFRPIDFRRLTF
jgi:hypothetical protein